MKSFKTTLIIGAAMAAFALTPAVSAQVTSVTDAVKAQAVDTVKDQAKKRAQNAVKDKALNTVKGTAYGSGAVETVEKVQGTVEKAKAYGSGNKDGGIVTKAKDSAVEKAKAYGSGNKDGGVVEHASDGAVEKAKAYGSANKDGGVVEKAKAYGSGNTAATSTSIPAIACPSGTTAQPNGTCMITGNFKGS